MSPIRFRIDNVDPVKVSNLKTLKIVQKVGNSKIRFVLTKDDGSHQKPFLVNQRFRK
jgi:hypothetical protein